MDKEVKGPVKTETKEPYVKPDFRHERVFAVAALQCGKTHSTQQGCNRIQKAS